MRPWLVPLAALLLAACDTGAPRPALLDSRPPPGLAPRFLPPEGWAWGAIQPSEGPALRYGVATPVGAARRAQVLILPDSQESAEVWFETARVLTQAGYVVWTLEWAGFGGSGRAAAPHDMIHAGQAGTAPEAVIALVSQVIRPDPDRPLSLMASGDAAAVALTALSDDLPVGSLILSAPDLSGGPALTPWERLATRAGLGRLPSPDWRPWSKTASAAAISAEADPWRAKVAHSWRVANPDLRQSGESLGWRVQRQQMAASAHPPAAVRRPHLILAGKAVGLASSEACIAAEGCQAVIAPALTSAPHLAREAERSIWLRSIADFLSQQIPPAAPERQNPGAIE